MIVAAWCKNNEWDDAGDDDDDDNDDNDDEENASWGIGNDDRSSSGTSSDDDECVDIDALRLTMVIYKITCPCCQSGSTIR